MPSSSPADTGPVTRAPTPAPVTEGGGRRWWLVLLVAVAFALLVVAIMVLSVWFEMLMFPLVPTETTPVMSQQIPQSAPPQLR